MEDGFVTRLNQLLDYLSIKPAELAEKMGIQRTSFNHLLSGRNKPGFEFMTRLHACYPSINLNWLVNGYGGITGYDDPKISQVETMEQETYIEPDLFSNIFNNPIQPEITPEPEVKLDLTKEIKPIVPAPEKENDPKEEAIDRIIIVYASGKIVEIKQ